MNHDKNVTTTIGHLIDGKIVADTERTQPVFNPATGQSTTSVALASKATVEAAIASAEAAFPAWRNTPPLKRARVMSKLKVLLEENADKIAALITAEHGKVLADAHGELQRGIENVEYASYAPELLKGEHSRNVGPHIDSWSEFQALGVTAGITPFNFPAMVPLWMWPMAVACGNTFVLKPSERDPTSAVHRPAGAGSRPAARRAQRGQRRQAGRGHAAARPARQGRELCGLHAHCRIHLQPKAASTASACRPWAAPRTTPCSCPTPMWTTP